MPITQIPFQDPVAPPERSQPEQLDLYTTQDWETAYREVDDRVPHLIIQLQDDLTRARWREALWISIIAHLVTVIAIILWVPVIQKYLPFHRAIVLAVDANKDKNVTFLALPPDAQKATRKPHTNIISDKDRIAMSRHPQLDPKELRKILTPPPGAPGMTGPPASQPAAPPAMAQNQPPAPPSQAARPQFDSNQTAQLQMPARPNNKNAFSKYGTAMSAGSAIQQAMQGAAANRAAGGGGQEGDFGLNSGARGKQYGALEVLTDTQGVDFGPYLQRILEDVRENWYRLIPESAQMGKKGKLAIEFAITRDGQVADMKLVAGSGDVALDRAAWGGITASNPFPPLPNEFSGPYLALRFRFYYNPDKSDLE